MAGRQLASETARRRICIALTIGIDRHALQPSATRAAGRCPSVFSFPCEPAARRTATLRSTRPCNPFAGQHSSFALENSAAIDPEQASVKKLMRTGSHFLRVPVCRGLPHRHRLSRARGFPGYSQRSLAFAASFVCHCILPGASAPPRFSGLMWSMT